MVNLAKIRKKAKKGVERGFSPSDGGLKAAATPEAKLQSFLATVGKKRAGIVQEVIAPPQDEVELLTFTLAEERYAIEIGDIAEIVSAQIATRIPNADSGIVGV